MKEQAAEFYRKYKLIIWPVVVGVCCLVILMLVVLPQLLTYFSKRTETDELNNRLGVLEAKAQELEQLDDKVYSNNLKLALGALPSDKEVPQSLNILQSFITQSGMTLENIRFLANTDPSSTEQKNTYQIGITVLGSLDSVKRLLLQVNNSPRIFRLDMINVNTLKGVSSVEADLTFTLFYEPQGTEIGSIDQPLPKLTDADQKLLGDLSNRTRIVSTGTSNLNIPLGKLNPFE